MNLSEFLPLLKDHPNKTITLNLPDGSTAPPHFHVTEVGHVSRSFIDCGGTSHRLDSCLLQIWVAHDYNHRLQAGKLARIIDLASAQFPSPDLPVEFEHEAPVLTQLTIVSCEISPHSLAFTLAYKATDCLAKETCLPKPDFSLPGADKATGNFQAINRLTS